MKTRCPMAFGRASVYHEGSPPRKWIVFMRYRQVLVAVFMSALCGAGFARAQQPESATPRSDAAPRSEGVSGLRRPVEQRGREERSVHDGILLSPLYVDISSTGDVTTRNQQIAQLFQKGDGAVSLQQRVVSVRLFGDTAVVSGTTS